MNFRKLNIFFETAKCLNMSKVAKNMYISQPSVSQAIAELEHELGVILFDRIGKKIYLTHEGEIYLEYVRRILNLYEEGINVVKASGEGKKGKLVIGASTTIGIYILPYIIKEFTQKNENIEISLIIENTAIIEDLILNNKVDFALVEGKVKSKEIIVEDVWNDNLVFIASKDNQLSNKQNIKLEELSKTNLIMREQGSGTREIVENFLKSKEIVYNAFMELGSSEAIIRVVEANLGIACVSEKCIDHKLKEGTLEKLNIDNFDLNRKLYLVHHYDKFISSNMKQFINEMKNIKL